jgi:hypothetical protein
MDRGPWIMCTCQQVLRSSPQRSSHRRSHISFLFCFFLFDLPSALITCKCDPEFLHDHLPSMATSQGLVGRTPDISSKNRGPIVNLVAWIAMVTMCLSVFTVLVSKYLMLRKLTWNDVSTPIRRVRSGRRLQPFSRDRRLPDLTLPVSPELQFVGKHDG